MKKSSFWRDTLQAVVNPQQFFGGLSDETAIGNALVKVVFYGLISAIFITLIAISETNISDGFGFLAIFGGMGMGFVVIVFNIFFLFTAAIVIMILSGLSGGALDYKKSVHVTAALEVVLIPMVVIGLKSHFDETLGYFINVVCYWTAIMMLYNALLYTFNAKRLPVKIISIILALVSLIPVANHPEFF